MKGLHQHLAGSIHHSARSYSDRKGDCERHTEHKLERPEIDSRHMTVSRSFSKCATLQILLGLVYDKIQCIFAHLNLGAKMHDRLFARRISEHMIWRFGFLPSLELCSLPVELSL